MRYCYPQSEYEQPSNTADMSVHSEPPHHIMLCYLTRPRNWKPVCSQKNPTSLPQHGIISSPLMTQGGQPCKQQNNAQGGPPCAAYLLRRAVRPPNSKMVRRADRPVQHICYAGRSALLTAKWCAGQDPFTRPGRNKINT